jgi:hypothetical protein
VLSVFASILLKLMAKYPLLFGISGVNAMNICEAHRVSLFFSLKPHSYQPLPTEFLSSFSVFNRIILCSVHIFLVGL